MFEFTNLNKFDIWPLYDCIKEYYPLGIKVTEDHQWENYNSYPGRKKFSEAMNKFFDEKYNKAWISFENGLSKTTKKEVVGNSMLTAPSFSCYVIFEKDSLKDLSRRKEIHIYLSLLGPYYTIVGQDRSEIDGTQYTGESFSYIESTNFIVVSPQFEFEDVFIKALKVVEKHFPDHRFVPFAFYKESIPGLQIGDDIYPGRIFNGLFNNGLDFNARILGEEYYKAEEWIRKDYSEPEGGWTSYPPLSALNDGNHA